MTPLETCLVLFVMAWLIVDPSRRLREIRRERRAVDPGLAQWREQQAALRKVLGF